MRHARRGANSPVHRGLCRISFNLPCMGPGELCYDHRQTVMFLTIHMRSNGAAETNVETRDVQAPYLSPGFGDFVLKTI